MIELMNVLTEPSSLCILLHSLGLTIFVSLNLNTLFASQSINLLYPGANLGWNYKGQSVENFCLVGVYGSRWSAG